jgi:hypothetical protein
MEIAKHRIITEFTFGCKFYRQKHPTSLAILDDAMKHLGCGERRQKFRDILDLPGE